MPAFHMRFDRVEYKVNRPIHVTLGDLELDDGALITVSVQYRPTLNLPFVAAPVKEDNPIVKAQPWSHLTPINVVFTPTAAGYFSLVLVAVTLATSGPTPGITSVSYNLGQKPFVVTA